jgi:hypothetical protein
MRVIDRLVLDEIYEINYLLKHGRLCRRRHDSGRHYVLTRRQKRLVNKLACKFIKDRFIKDAMYYDIAPAIAAAMPVLIPLIKQAALMAVSSAVIQPLANKVIGGAVKLTTTKTGDTYAESIGINFKNDMDRFINALKKEGNFLSQKISSIYQRIRGLL